MFLLPLLINCLVFLRVNGKQLLFPVGVVYFEPEVTLATNS